MDIESMEQALRQVGASSGASEGHGILAGLLCAKGQVEREKWLRDLSVKTPEKGDGAGHEAVVLLGELYEQTVSQLNSPLLEFEPLLPEDEAPLAQRTRALGEWCQGFLMGLGIGGVRRERLPPDSTELLHDFAQLARAGDYELGGGEEDEAAYSELVEYVRTGVLLVNEELNPTKAPPRNERLH